MKSHLTAAAMTAALLSATPVFTHAAAAQPGPGGSSGSYTVPVIIGAAAGATVGALLWPMVMPAAVVTAPAAAEVAAPGAMAVAAEAGGWGWGAFITTRAAVGAVIGGALGFIAAR